jgi:hypothetical protein
LGKVGCGILANEYTAVHMEPKKLWMTNSIFNLWFPLYWMITLVGHA